MITRGRWKSPLRMGLTPVRVPKCLRLKVGAPIMAGRRYKLAQKSRDPKIDNRQ